MVTPLSWLLLLVETILQGDLPIAVWDLEWVGSRPLTILTVRASLKSGQSVPETAIDAESREPGCSRVIRSRFSG